MSVAYVVAATQTIPLDLVIEQEGVGGVTGKTPVVSVRDGATLNRYLDWHDNTFKTAGWTLRDASMSEVRRGHYTRQVDLDAIGVINGNILAAEYHVDDGGDIIGDAEDIIVVGSDALISVAQLIADVELIRKSITNRMEEFPGTPGALILWDDDAVTPLLQWQLRDAAGNGIIATVGSPAKRSRGT